MLPTAERLAVRAATVFVAADSFDPLAERIRGIVAGSPEEDRDTAPTGRLMTAIRSYPFARQQSRFDIATSLSLDLRLSRPVEVTDNPFGHGIHFHLAPGINGFGFGYDKNDRADTEAEVARRFHTHYPSIDVDGYDRVRRNLTVVTFDGWAGQPCREDRIEIDRWNDDGVCVRTTVAFEAEPWEHERSAR